jgi:hypothetical protein
MQTPKIDDLDRPIWGCAAIAEIVERPTGQVFYMLNRGMIDATKVGKQWMTTKRRLLNQFAGRCDTTRRSGSAEARA